MKKHEFLIVLLICLGLTFIFSACEKPNCDCDSDPSVIISKTEYENAPTDPQMKIVNVEIEGDCLKIKFESGGCNGETWIKKLIDRGDLIKTSPPQRTLRFSLDNTEMCDALIYKEISFNIKCLRVEGDKKIQLNIADKELLYKY
jgi:hypothetical protein